MLVHVLPVLALRLDAYCAVIRVAYGLSLEEKHNKKRKYDLAIRKSCRHDELSLFFQNLLSFFIFYLRRVKTTRQAENLHHLHFTRMCVNVCVCALGRKIVDTV